MTQFNFLLIICVVLYQFLGLSKKCLRNVVCCLACCSILIFRKISIPTKPINLPFSTKDIICMFEMNDRFEVAEDNIPVDLLKIPGKKKIHSRKWCSYYQIGCHQQKAQEETPGTEGLHCHAST